MTPQLRRTARVIALNDDGHVLLFRAEDKLDTNPACWITPGGGIEAGEDVVAAACREMFEETGLVVTADDLIGPVAITEGEWQFRGTTYYGDDTYFLVRVATFDPDPKNVDEIEVDILGEHRWWHPDDLDTCTERVWPLELGPLIRDIHAGVAISEPRQLPW